MAVYQYPTNEKQCACTHVGLERRTDGCTLCPRKSHAHPEKHSEVTAPSNRVSQPQRGVLQHRSPKALTVLFVTCDRMRCVEVAIVRLAEGCRYNKRHRSHASGSACGALETGYSVPEDRVLLEQDSAQWYEPQRCKGNRMAWTRDISAPQLVPLRRAR